MAEVQRKPANDEGHVEVSTTVLIKSMRCHEGWALGKELCSMLLLQMLFV